MYIKIKSIYDILSLISLFSYLYFFYSLDILLIIGCMLCVCIHKIVKEITTDWYPPIFKRPDGACDCNLFNTGGLVDMKSGFPSGHVATISFLMNYILNCPCVTDASIDYKTIILYNIPIVLVAYARVMKGCHNIIQVIAGYLLGLGVACLLKKYKYYFENITSRLQTSINNILVR